MKNALDISRDVPLQRTAARGDGCEVAGANEQLVVIFKQQGPLGSVQLRLALFGGDGVVTFDLRDGDLVSGQ